MKAKSFPITLQPPPFFPDHHVDNRPVLPAVEAMELLAADTGSRFPDIDVRRLSQLRLDKFLFLDGQSPLVVINRLNQGEDGAIRTTLATRFRSPGTAITRTLEHAAVDFGGAIEPVSAPPLDVSASLTGVCTVVDPERIYREMVPFGPAYRNIRDPLLISPDGALAHVGSPQPSDPRTNLHLGSPYVLDAAFHAACVWCQRYRGGVAFPVAIDRRTIVHPTRLDETYTARIVPVQTNNELYVFNIFIFDDAGGLREVLKGVHMRDVSRGRNTPPEGFYDSKPEEPLQSFASAVSDLVLIERCAVAPFAKTALSEREAARLAPMIGKRAQGYLSTRLALKRLSRMLNDNTNNREPFKIETVAENGQSPRCSTTIGTPPFCSVSHDRRFTVAVATDRPVGVDVEPLSEKPLGAMDLYMNKEEQAMVDGSTIGKAACALRIWSLKEASAKALGIGLAESWERTRVVEVSEMVSLIKINGGRRLTAIHQTIEDHLFTLLIVDKVAS